MTLNEVVAAAEKDGLSYGQWVAKNRSDEMVRKKRKSKSKDKRIKIDIDEVASMYMAGKNPRDIAKEIGVTPAAVYVVIKTLDLKRLEAV